MIRSNRIHSRKVCILGDRAVGKTSLVRRYLKGDFSPEYCATVGARIDKAQLQVDRDKLKLMLWDIQGERDSRRGYNDYLKGASAIIYVVDGTRIDTLETAMEYRQDIESRAGRPLPSILLFNKADLVKNWEISSSMINDAEMDGIIALLTSAREGSGVSTAFNLLAKVVLGKASMVST